MLPKQVVQYGLGWVLLAACASARPSANETPELVYTATPEVGATATRVARPTVDFGGAKSVTVVGDGVGNFYVAYGSGQSLWVARSSDGGLSFGAPVLASGEQAVHVLAVERPALAVSGDGKQVGVAWLAMAADYATVTVWYAASADGGQTFGPAQPVGQETAGETTMVQVALDEAGNPALAWLNGRHLRFARSQDGGATFAAVRNLGAAACECCQPAAVFVEENFYLAYRSLESSAQGDIRDMALLRSTNGGDAFAPMTQVSDGHWYLNACPVAGPALAVQGARVYVAWMDGRNEPPGTFSRGEVWLAVSADGGASFMPNIRVSADETLHHSLPALGVGPTGRVHLAWEAQGPEARVLFYTTSDDEGATFAPLAVVAQAEATRGKPSMATLAVSPAGQVVLAWVDRLGARVMAMDEK